MKCGGDSSSVDKNRLRVSFQEALNWIAFHNLAGMSVGPIPLGIRLTDKSYFEDWALGRLDFAVELLLDRATHGKIRIYDGNEFSAIVLSAEFLAKAEYIDIDENDGKPNHPRLVVREKVDDPDDPDESYYEISKEHHILSVDYDDLLAEFWGNEKSTLPTSVAGPSNTPETPIRRRANGAGAPMKHDWPGFMAEALDRCGRDSAINRQADLEKQMADWCANNWPSEPTASAIRQWAGAAFKKAKKSAGLSNSEEANNSEPSTP